MSVRTLILVLLVASLSFTASIANKPDKEKWISLFDGKSLDGWTVKIKGYKAGENFGNTFRVEDGVMKVGYAKYENFEGKFGHIFYKKSYSHYRLRLEYRFLGDQVPGGPGWAFRNSGIMLHCQSPQSMGKDQNFPVSIEVQLLGGREAGDRTTANLCTPGTNVVMNGELVRRHCTGSTSKTFRGDEWVAVEVGSTRGRGDQAHHGWQGSVDIRRASTR